MRGAGKRPVVTWSLLAVNALVWLLQEAAGGSQDQEVLLDFGAMFGPLIADGEYWRLFTATFLHVGVMHLLINGLILLIFGQMVERIYGSPRFAAIYFGAGLSGSVASYLLNSIAIGAGASGAIFGVIGAFAAYFLARRAVLGEMGRQTLSGILVLAGANLVFGLANPEIDNWAHMGGFVAGLALGMALVPRPGPIVIPFAPPSSSQQARPLSVRLLVIPALGVVLVAGVWLGTATLPDNPETRLLRAERMINRQSYEMALGEIEIAERLQGSVAEASYLRGRILAELGDAAGARRELFKAVAFARQLGDQDTADKASELLASLGTQG